MTPEQFSRLATDVMDGLLKMESVLARGLVKLPVNTSPYALRDLKNARDAVSLVRLDAQEEAHA